MIRGRVLVIDGDEWAVTALVRALQEKGYVVDASGEAVVGFRKASETLPDCIVLSPELPDIDGAWVARKVRTEAGALSKVPILFVGELTDRSVHAQTLNAGADVFLARPITNDEIVAQIGALIAMARRLDGKEVDGSPSSATAAAAIRGDLSAFPLASLLMMFEMERRSGLIEVVAMSGKRASLTLTDGLFASTEVAGAPRPALEVLREVLSWRAGRFSFQPRESKNLPAPRASVGALVLEAMRLEDEEKSPMHELSSEDLVDAVESAADGKRAEKITAHDDKVIVRPDLAQPPHPKAAS
ncbi:MAG: response regulator [Labilithrix sp.]|nr:response regulator [Labilithrix sp.]MBX3222689.1 response regulator [Labilithrix sp.]